MHLPRLSIVVPTLNEAEIIVPLLASLQQFRRRGAEVIVADGASQDRTLELAAPLADRAIVVERGRARQMNAGAGIASGDVLLFLHADSQLPVDADMQIDHELSASKSKWGRFDIKLTGRHPLLRIVEFSMNWRSRLTAIATGDQAMFIKRSLFDDVGGFPDIALMEDVAMSARLNAHSRPLCLRARVLASSRRWEQRGILRSIMLMWRLRLLYFLGTDPKVLARMYYGHG